MYEAPTEIELVARHRIAERSATAHPAGRRPAVHGARPAPLGGALLPRRTRLAGTLRRVADRIDP